MIYFRFHKGGFEESLKTEKKFKRIKDLFKFLGDSNCVIRFYCFDDRNNIGDTFIVIGCNGYPIGFIYLKNGGLENEKN